MRMLDLDTKHSVKNLSLYLTPQEAKQIHYELGNLLNDPETNEHFHVNDKNYTREISCSIITENKLKNIERYNKLEQQILTEK